MLLFANILLRQACPAKVYNTLTKIIPSRDVRQRITEMGLRHLNQQKDIL